MGVVVVVPSAILPVWPPPFSLMRDVMQHSLGKTLARLRISHTLSP